MRAKKMQTANLRQMQSAFLIGKMDTVRGSATMDIVELAHPASCWIVAEHPVISVWSPALRTANAEPVKDTPAMYMEPVRLRDSETKFSDQIPVVSFIQKAHSWKKWSFMDQFGPFIQAKNQSVK